MDNKILLAFVLFTACYPCEPEPSAGYPGTAIDYEILPPNNCYETLYCLDIITDNKAEYNIALGAFYDWEASTEFTIKLSEDWELCNKVIIKILDEQDPEILEIIRATLQHFRGYSDGETIYINRDRTCGAKGTTIRHELGHRFGLSHSNIEGTIMYPYFTDLAPTNVMTNDVLMYLLNCSKKED